MGINPFAFWEQNAKLEFAKGDVRIYNLHGHQYLFIDQILYASTTEYKWYVRNVFQHAKGNVLEIGLGLGCASKIILANKKVKKLTTIENHPEVIQAFGLPLPRHKVLHADVYTWVDNYPDNAKKYDLIFVDHYTVQDEQTLVELASLKQKLVRLLSPQGKIIFWVEENADQKDKDFIKGLWV